ncbi:MAG: fused MFS/spermidine synthase [Alphaproteobacteria bacterium]|nr:fused MFS/spermidine synthase [Alphaproteobacteria bacterium]
MFAVFNLSIFTSAFLLFLIQPMVANILLPKVGGSPNIWNTCSVFFQVSLLVGYFYSYLVSQKLSLKRQIITHCALLFCALWAVNFHFQSDDISVTSPVSGTLFSLLKNIFIPFVLLSTTSPLIQRWLSLSTLKESKNPYMLYVCSNVGSLLALYAYPLVFEKKLTISAQGNLWHILFALFFATVVILGIYLNKTVKNQPAETKTAAEPMEKTNPILIFYWIFFAFVPSSLMLGVTSHLSTDIGGFPFLWILPLSLYLLSFILTFSRFYTERISTLFQILYVASALIAVYFFFSAPIKSTLKYNLQYNVFLVCLHCILYFIFSIYCHGILAGKKPSPEKLTLFYLCLAIGGALGGIFNTFIAPYIFLFIWEYPFVIALSLPFVINDFPTRKKDFIKIILQIILLLVFLFFAQLIFKQKSNFVFQKRNFFGTVSIVQQANPSDPAILLKLYHGDTVHGRQKFSVSNDQKIYNFDPDIYYGSKAAVKDFFSVFKRSYAPDVAWLGLGAGAIICYAQPETKHNIVEIDRDIVDISTKYHYFRYVEHCAPQADIKVGDARIEIAKEKNQKYDLIAFDAFSSHFIPVHLTTKEAIETYRSKLRPDGIILFHISSRAFDMEPILTRIAEELNMAFIVRYHSEKDFRYPQWGVLSNSYNDPEIKALLAMPGWRKGEMKEDTMLWTDDFHNLLSALRR